MAYKPSRSNTSSRTQNTTAAHGKRTASSRLNRRRYAELLSNTLPRIIEDNLELERTARSVEPLLEKGESRTAEEEALCRLLLKLIDDYQKTHPVISRLAPHEALQALLEARSLRQVDLLGIFGSRSRISDAVNGKRAISKTHARKLADLFKVPVGLFV